MRRAGVRDTRHGGELLEIPSTRGSCRLVKHEMNDMKRIKEKSGIIHFRNPATPDRCLCGVEAASTVHGLFGDERELFRESNEPVTCRDCAKVYALVKDEPWRSVDRRALLCGCLHATDGDGPVASEPASVAAILENAACDSITDNAEDKEDRDGSNW